MAKYLKADNCGPVPYPDGSGRLLMAGDVVEGDEWAGLVAVGYVVELPEPAAPPAPTPSVATPEVEPPGLEATEGQAEESNGTSNDGAAAPAVDPETAGGPSAEGGAGSKSPRRRYQRG